MSLTPPPTAPAPTDSTADFKVKAFNLVAWFATFVTEMTATVSDVVGYVATALGYANAASSSASASAASATASATSASAAAGSAAAAAASANLTVWASGTTYSAGVSVLDPGDSYAVYTRQITGAGTTQPHLDATNWRISFQGLKPIAVLTPTAAANLDALSVFTSQYDNYRIIVDGVKPSADDTLTLRLAASGVVDAGTNYAINATVSSQAVITSNVATGTAANQTLAAGKGVSIVIDVLNANDATNMKTISSSGSTHSAATPTYTAIVCASVYTAANAVSGFRLYWASGANFAATGKVRIYGYMNT